MKNFILKNLDKIIFVAILTLILTFFVAMGVSMMLAISKSTSELREEIKMEARSDFVRGIVGNFNCENPGEFYLKVGEKIVGYAPICEPQEK